MGQLRPKQTGQNHRNSHLTSIRGIYLFYNSQGEVIYVGKAKRQDVWFEMKSAYNRTRDSQKIYKVKYPKTGTRIEAAYHSERQIIKQPIQLHELASFFSVYEIESSLIDHLEAAIIRMIPNDCVNIKIEKIKSKRIRPKRK